MFSSKLLDDLKSKYADDGLERVGFINCGNLIEVDNIHSTPYKSFDVSPVDLINNSQAEATWHTHPSATGNLSYGDYQSFVSWPDKLHFIVGNDGVFCYKYDRETQSLLAVLPCELFSTDT